MKQTALYQQHLVLGAKMVAFAGYLMPVQYRGISAEHHCVREGIGVFDVSHMGEFILQGENALALIQQLCSNDAAKLEVGKVQYTCMPNETGGIVDDLLVYRMDSATYMLVVNSGNIQKDREWISRHNDFGVELLDISDRTTLLAIQGPKTVEALQPLTNLDLAAMDYYTFKKGSFAGIENVIISATGYTGAGGFELYVDNVDAETLWNAVLKAGEPFHIQPIGLGARDSLRLEMGYCLYGNDIDGTTSPLEAGLGWITRFNKEFTNSAGLQQQKQTGVSRRLVGFEMIDRGIPRQGYEILDADGRLMGKVTSGTQSPSLGKGIGMGYVQSGYAAEEIFIRIRDKSLAARVVKLPFITSNPESSKDL